MVSTRSNNSANKKLGKSRKLVDYAESETSDNEEIVTPSSRSRSRSSHYESSDSESSHSESSHSESSSSSYSESSGSSSQSSQETVVSEYSVSSNEECNHDENDENDSDYEYESQSESDDDDEEYDCEFDELTILHNKLLKWKEMNNVTSEDAMLIHSLLMLRFA